jgi:hypothetical protein
MLAPPLPALVGYFTVLVRRLVLAIGLHRVGGVLQDRLCESHRLMDGAAWPAAVDHVRSLAEAWHALEFASPVQAELVNSVRAAG